jgi:glycosyltransferase involved in cell wall biosynthesis
MTTSLPATLFAGRGNGGVCWYRCALPAMHLGQDWVGIAGEPEALSTYGGVGRHTASFADFAEYEVVVLQYQASPSWVRGIRQLQERGTRVIFEIDDYARSVRKKADHAAAKHFGREFLRHFELTMRVADGVICSTEWLAKRYRSINPNTWVCPNAIDLARYDLHREPTDHVAIGWAGGTGHRRAVEAWLPAIEAVMERHPHTRFVSVGEFFAGRLSARFGEERCLAVPPSSLETYPAAMSMFDLALAPSGRETFYLGKSDLRWLESSALRVPLVADSRVYPEIRDGETGLLAHTAEEAEAAIERLVVNTELRRHLGQAAYEDVAARRSLEVAGDRWAEVLQEVVTEGPRVAKAA